MKSCQLRHAVLSIVSCFPCFPWPWVYTCRLGSDPCLYFLCWLWITLVAYLSFRSMVWTLTMILNFPKTNIRCRLQICILSSLTCIFFFLMTDYHVCIAGGIYAQFTRGTFHTAKYPYRHIHAIKRHIKPSTHRFRFNTHSLPYPPYPHTCITPIKSDLFNTRSL